LIFTAAYAAFAIANAALPNSPQHN